MGAGETTASSGALSSSALAVGMLTLFQRKAGEKTMGDAATRKMTGYARGRKRG